MELSNESMDKYMLPKKLRSPAKDALEPVNEKNGSGSGTGTFMPTWVKTGSSVLSGHKIKFSRPVIRHAEKDCLTSPASISVWNFLAATPDVVNIEAPMPYLH